MARTLRFRATPETIRVEQDGGGVLYEDEAVLALIYNARTEDIEVLAWGREALKVPERVHELKLADAGDRCACMVPQEEARWYDGDRGLGAAPAPRFDNPWEHHGEIILVRPFAPGAGSIRTWIWLLTRARWGLLSSSSFAQRWWQRLAASTDIVLPERPASTRDHDQLVRGLWDWFGGRLRLDGVPLALREPARLRLRDWLVNAVCVAIPAVLAAMRASRGIPAFNRVLGVLTLVSLGFAFFYTRHATRRDPLALPDDSDGRTNRVLREQAAADADPRDYQGAAQFRLGITPNSNWFPVPLFGWFAAVFASIPLLPHARAMPAPLAVAYAILVIGGMIFSVWLGFRLAGTRLALGERGITVRLSGVYSRPLHIPYTRIRHVGMTLEGTGPVLQIRFQDGQQVSVGFPKNDRSAEKTVKLVLAAESAITPRLRRPGSYRMPGAATAEGSDGSH